MAQEKRLDDIITLDVPRIGKRQYTRAELLTLRGRINYALRDPLTKEQHVAQAREAAKQRWAKKRTQETK